MNNIIKKLKNVTCKQMKYSSVRLKKTDNYEKLFKNYDKIKYIKVEIKLIQQKYGIPNHSVQN